MVAIVYLTYLVECWIAVACFNLDLHVPVFKIGEPGSYFGFSTAQHQINVYKQTETTHVLLVGAPKDNISSSIFPPEAHDLVRPGAVYSCPLSSFTDDCTILPTDTSVPQDDDDRNNQWMGVSVGSQGNDRGNAAACAHRYKRATQDYTWSPGFCVVLTNALDELYYHQPCEGKSTREGHGEYGYCQSGTSLDISKDGDLLVGAPGPYNWRGMIAKNTVNLTLFTATAWHYSPVEKVRPNMPLSTPQPTLSYYSYMGMSSHISYLWRGHKTYIGGAPRSNKVGEVLIYLNEENPSSDWLVLQRTLRGEQFASGFGYALASFDINGDFLDDLVVGAPFYHGEGIGGVIYLYINSRSRGLASDSERVMITSRQMPAAECTQLDCTNARFGFSLSTIGDVDQDGYNDLAVGAPFEGDGAVYIFRGSSTGLVPKYSQRITASNLHLSPLAAPLQTFGYSLAGGNDMDHNGYPDLVIGSYKSDTATVLRARPVIHVIADFSSEPYRVNHFETQCPFDGHPNNCFKLKVCLKFTAQPLEQYTSPLMMNYRIEAEKFTGASISRAFFRGRPQEQNHVFDNTVKLFDQRQNRFKCKKHIVYIIRSNRDFLNPLAFRLTYSLPATAPPSMSVGDADIPDLSVHPVLDPHASQMDLMVPFVKNCGTDDICQSDLRVEAMFQLSIDQETRLPLLKVGETKTLRLNIRVSNLAEDAHESTLTCVLPEGVEYTNVDSLQIQNYYTCDSIDNIVTCNTGNPLPQGEVAEFTLRLNPVGVDASHRRLDFELFANTTSEDVNIADNTLSMTVKVIVEADMLVRGDSDPREVYYGGVIKGESAMRSEKEIGPHVVHTYEIKNTGDGRIRRSDLTILWPYEALSPYPHGKHVLYVMEPPKVDAPDVCVMSKDFINPLDLAIDESSTLDALAKHSTDNSMSGGVVSHRSTRELRSYDKQLVKAHIVREGDKVSYAVHMTCDPRRPTAKCFRITCQLGDMWNGDSSVVKIRARLWNSTFAEDYANVDYVQISSYAEVSIDPILNVQQPSTLNDHFLISTKAIKNMKQEEGRGVPLWVIILAVIGGLVLLVIIIVALWKCGFFKRRRPTDMLSHRGTLKKRKKKAKQPHNYDDDAY